MRLVGAEEKAEGIFFFGAVLHEGIDFIEIGILSVGDFFPGKHAAGRNVGFAALSNAVAEGLEILHDALGAVFDVSVIRVGSAGDWIESGVDVVAGGGAHRRGLEAAGEAHSFASELVDVGGVGLSAVAPEIPKGAVVGDDEDDVGLGGGS